MIDFSHSPIKKKGYGGANGSKLSIVYNDNLYMLKFPIFYLTNPNLVYKNSFISEYLGCHIFNMLGVEAQETLIGIFKYNNELRYVVACKDMTSKNTVLIDFASIKNQIIDTISNSNCTELRDILDTIHEQKVVDPKQLEEHFWNMFVIDAFIGNSHRHNGNWGFLYNQETDEMKIAPIYDCDLTLYPNLDDELIEKIMKNKAKMITSVFDIPTSAILIHGKRANYFETITSLKYPGCNEAIKRIVPRIDLDKINELIDEVEQLSAIHKEFLKEMLKLRMRYILKYAYDKLLK